MTIVVRLWRLLRQLRATMWSVPQRMARVALVACMVGLGGGLGTGARKLVDPEPTGRVACVADDISRDA